MLYPLYQKTNTGSKKSGNKCTLCMFPNFAIGAIINMLETAGDVCPAEKEF